MQLILPTIPPPCQRGKVCKNGGFYSPTKAKEQALALEMMAILSHQSPRPNYPITGPCNVSITYNFGLNPYTVITIEPLDIPLFAPHGDIDNRDKTVLDSLQKANIFPNDSLVYQLSSKYQQIPTKG